MPLNLWTHYLLILISIGIISLENFFMDATKRPSSGNYQIFISKETIRKKTNSWRSDEIHDCCQKSPEMVEKSLELND